MPVRGAAHVPERPHQHLSAGQPQAGHRQQRPLGHHHQLSRRRARPHACDRGRSGGVSGRDALARHGTRAGYRFLHRGLGGVPYSGTGGLRAGEAAGGLYGYRHFRAVPLPHGLRGHADESLRAPRRDAPAHRIHHRVPAALCAAAH